jgi:hypothetical protein
VIKSLEKFKERITKLKESIKSGLDKLENILEGNNYNTSNDGKAYFSGA